MAIRLKGFDGFIRAHDRRRASEAFRTNLSHKIQRQLVLLRGDVVQYIGSERHGVPNSPLTILVKGSGRPLVDRGDLRQSLNVGVEQVGSGVHGAVGVLRTKRSRDGQKLWTIAVSLHDGFTIRVTDAVRRAVFAEMHKRGRRRGVAFEGRGGLKTWVVRGRPFLKAPLDDATPRIIRALGEGVKTTLKEL